MAVVAVTFNGTRLDDSDSNTDWDNYVVGGGAPASEFPLAYQVTSGTTAGAVNKKITSTTARQGVERYNATGQDMTGTNKLWFCKVYASDAFDLNTTWGVEVNMGSADNSNKHIYNIAGTGANLSVYNTYPQQGGYLITSIDPSIDGWAETADSGGAFDQTAVRFFAVGMQFVNGTAKSENVAMDSIDIGKGLTLVGGDGASTDGTYIDFVTEDQDDKTNRWGVVTGSGDVVRCNGILEIGNATATGFTDTTSIVLFPDGYHSAGTVGVEVDIQNASTTVTDDALLIGEGSNAGSSDTRPDYVVSGTSGSFSMGAQLKNFRNVTFTSACDVDGADIECQLLTQNSANIENSIIRTNSATSVACLQDPTFGTTTDLNNCDFIQAGSGHAIEIDTAGTYTFTGLTFTGYGANTTDSAAIDVTETSGTVTIQYSGTAPTYKTAGATVVLEADPVTALVNIKDENGNNIEGANVYLEAADGTGDLPFEQSITSISRSGTTATVTFAAAHGLKTGDYLKLEGITDKTEDLSGAFEVTVTSTTVCTYTTTDSGSTSYTGTITGTGATIYGTTNSSGNASSTRSWGANQPVVGVARYLNTEDTYYFDGSDAAATDEGADWSNVTNADDGSLSTSATFNTLGTVSVLKIQGTNAPATGGTISQVRARVYGQGGATTATTTVHTDGEAESLGTPAAPTASAGWGSYVTLSTPTGGWTWAKLQALEIETNFDAGAGSAGSFYKAEIAVTSTGGGVYYKDIQLNDTISTTNGLTINRRLTPDS